MTSQNLSIPPQVATPADARPVLVTLRLVAKDGDAFKQHLRQVIPVTRKASGCKYSYSNQNNERPNEFLLVQEWTSSFQQQQYLAWREQTGDLAVFASFLAAPPVVESFTLFERA